MRIAAFIVTGVLAGVLLAPQGALAQRALTDCDKLTNDDAYNKCLASFGPKRGQHVPAGSTVYPDAVDAPPRAGAPSAPSSPDARSAREGNSARASRASGRRNLGYRGLRGNGSTVVVTQLKGGRLRFQIVMPQRR